MRINTCQFGCSSTARPATEYAEQIQKQARRFGESAGAKWITMKREDNGVCLRTFHRAIA
jgi:hypothetical protein